MPGVEKLADLQRGDEEMKLGEAASAAKANGSPNGGILHSLVEKVAGPVKNRVQDPNLKFLIYGRTGWIGGLLGKICEKQGICYEYGSGRLENRSQLEKDIATVKPTHVFNAAGVTGRPNVDWCESHKVETIRANVVGTLTLADVCKQNHLLLVNYATGCIFEYDEKHQLGSGVGFLEEDKPNFFGSYYSKTKAMVSDLFLLA
jgi:UDP-glucose 4,6-dehydratase